MFTLIVNAGSSSLKVSLYKEEKNKQVLYEHFHYDSLGTNTHLFVGKKKLLVDTVDAAHALRHCIEYVREECGVVIHRFIHRVVHGGEFYNSPVRITQQVKDRISALSLLAPLHNPHNLACIEIVEHIAPGVEQFAVFDTAYHQSIPKAAYTYGLDKELASKYKVRKYGFHGISHEYLAQSAQKITKKKKIITCHLGNGNSITANKNVKSVDTSMGFTPTDGLIMGTRCGALDPEVPLYLMRVLRTNNQRVHDVLCCEGGFLGLTGEQDVRAIWARKNKDDLEALSVLSYQIKKYVGSYNAVLGGVDVIVFSGGVGENAWYIRKEALQGLEHLGVRLDLAKNRKAVNVSKATAIHKKNSKVRVYVIPCDEEAQMLELVNKRTK